MFMRRLTPEDAPTFQALRLAALQETPIAFGSSFEEEKNLSLSSIESQLAFRFDRGIFGAFENNELIGLAALGRENLKNFAHKAFIWGMYVKPEHRSKGIARSLLNETLSLASSIPEILQVNLSVNASNTVAVRLYESSGFKVFGREPCALFINNELHDEIHMQFRFTDSRTLTPHI